MNKVKRWLAACLAVFMLLGNIGFADSNPEAHLPKEEEAIELPVKEPENVPTEIPTDVPANEPAVEPTDDPEDVPTDEPIEEPVNEPVGEPVAEPLEESTEESSNDPEPSNPFNMPVVQNETLLMPASELQIGQRSKISAAAKHVHDWGAWEPLAPGGWDQPLTHKRTCKSDSSHTETQNCTENHIAWVYNNEKYHHEILECTVCKRSITNMSGEFTHQYSTATCISPAICNVCKHQKELDSDAHDWGKWTSNGDGTHTRVCSHDSTHTETLNCSGGNKVCGSKSICADCGSEYGDIVEHDWDVWKHSAYNKHTRTCKNDSSHTQTENCQNEFLGWEYYNEAWHARKYICKGCGNETTSVGGTNTHQYSAATCAKPATCTVCLHEKGETDPDAHDWGEWVLNNNYIQKHTRACKNDPSHTQTESCENEFVRWEYYNEKWHAAKYICKGCGSGTTAVSGTNTHQYSTSTCTTAATCAVCLHVKGGTDANAHDWGEWKSNDNGTHTRVCKNDASHTETKACTNLSAWSYYSTDAHSANCNDCGCEVVQPHYGGDGSCTTTCEGCNEEYEPANGEHRNMSAWEKVSGTQHSRYCLTCGYGQEYANHTGGAATCTEDGICKDCHEAYISASGHDWGEWKSNDNGTHTRVCKNDANHTETKACTNLSAWTYYSTDAHSANCNDCGCEVVQPHYGGDGSCTTTCEGCNEEYEPANGEHRNMSAWEKVSGTQHSRYCLTCGYGQEYANHTGGAATCTEDGICKDCHEAYISASGHDWGEWKSNDNGTHTRVCKNDANHTETKAHDWGEWVYIDTSIHSRVCVDCLEVEDGNHSGGVVTCTEDGICKDCHEAYISASGHDWGEWKSNDNGTHTRVCKNDANHTETKAHDWGEWVYIDTSIHSRVCVDCLEVEDANHTGGVATCTEDGICSVCNTAYPSKLGHIPGEAATCTTDQLCTRPGCGAVLAKKLGHTEIVDAAVAPTCTATGLTEGKHCDVCLTVLLAQDIVPATGHSYDSVTVRPSCTKAGYTKHTCSVCGESYTDSEKRAFGHWYDLWTPNMDGTHSADCKRSGCDHVGTADCTLYEVTAIDGESEAILTVCPVCGDYEDTPFEVVLNAIIKAVERNALPRGEQIVRSMETPFDGVLYAFTAAYEYAGKVENFKGNVSVTLTLDAQRYTDFRLVRVDVTPATETAERIEVWTDIAFTYEEGLLTFETETAGLFLLLPAE